MTGPAPTPEFLALAAALAGRYLLEEEIGRGGMGIVYRARDIALDRTVAIKLLPPSFAADPDLRSRFLQEARTAAGLSHPHIVPVHAVEDHGAIVCFVMAYVPGMTLAQRVRAEGPMPAEAVTRLVREVAWALAYAHQRGIVHRDIKPENILLERGSGRALVSDFGIAQLAESSTTPRGVLRGTTRYLSPEQAAGAPLDGRSDLYSLGVTAWFALTGRLPFEGDNAAALILRQAAEPAPPIALARRGVPRPLAAAIDRCLAREPSARFPSGEALADALDGGAAPPVPPVLRRLAGEISEGTVDITGFATLAIVAGISQSLTRDFFGFGFVYTLSLVTLMIGLLGLRGLLVTRLAREAIGEGWQARDLERAVEREARERSERAPAPPLGRRFALYLGGLVALTLLWLGPKQWAQGDFSGVLTWVIELVSLAVPVALGRWLGAALEAPRDGKPGLLTRAFLRFKGALIFRAASMGLKHRATPAALDDRPTEVVLAGAARDLLRALPAPERDRMHDAGPLVEELEATARSLRRRLDDLDAAAGAVGGEDSPQRRNALAELASARQGTVARLATALEALDQLRLDLLRARAGVAGGDGLTESLAALERLSSRMQEEITPTP
ncbi:MAG: protein kinase [Gemmatimonadales bacterium]